MVGEENFVQAQVRATGQGLSTGRVKEAKNLPALKGERYLFSRFMTIQTLGKKRLCNCAEQEGEMKVKKIKRKKKRGKTYN